MILKSRGDFFQMKFVSMKKVHEGKFLSRYDIVYETIDGGMKNYEMVSRAKDRTQFDQLHDHKPEAVIMIMHDPSGEKLLINREFRLAMGEFIYNFPAGLVDEGEDLDTSAARELREETGLKLVRIDERMKESYSAEGICDEMGVVCVGVAEGEPIPSPDPVEEIQAAWYTKEEVRELLQKERFSGRTQLYAYMWAKEYAVMKKTVVGRGLIAALIAIAIILGVQYGTAWHTYRTALDFPEAAQASVVVSVLYSDQGQSVKLDE